MVDPPRVQAVPLNVSRRRNQSRGSRVRSLAVGNRRQKRDRVAGVRRRSTEIQDYRNVTSQYEASRGFSRRVAGSFVKLRRRRGFDNTFSLSCIVDEPQPGASPLLESSPRAGKKRARKLLLFRVYRVTLEPLEPARHSYLAASSTPSPFLAQRFPPRLAFTLRECLWNRGRAKVSLFMECCLCLFGWQGILLLLLFSSLFLCV